MKLAKDAFDSNHIDTSATPDAAIVRIMDSNSTSCHQEQVRPKRKKGMMSSCSHWEGADESDKTYADKDGGDNEDDDVADAY